MRFSEVAGVLRYMDADCGPVVFAGDHKQLGPFADCAVQSAKELIDMSLFEFLVRRGGVSVPSVTLTQQHRMHPEICSLASSIAYVGTLRTHSSRVATSYRGYDGIRADMPVGSAMPLAMFDTRGMVESQPYGDSCTNRGDVNVALVIREFIVTRKLSAEDILFVTRYSAQCDLMQDVLDGSGNQSMCAVETCTTASVQGDERPVVVYSVVRSGPANLGIGFADDTRILVVSFTRARDCLVIVGDTQTLHACDRKGMWQSTLDYLREKKLMFRCRPQDVH